MLLMQNQIIQAQKQVCVCVCVLCVLEGGCNDGSFGFEVLLRPAGKNVKSEGLIDGEPNLTVHSCQMDMWQAKNNLELSVWFCSP